MTFIELKVETPEEKQSLDIYSNKRMITEPHTNVDLNVVNEKMT